MVYKLFDKNISGEAIKIENIPNKELAEELKTLECKPIITKFNKRKVHSSFIVILGELILLIYDW